GFSGQIVLSRLDPFYVPPGASVGPWPKAPSAATPPASASQTWRAQDRCAPTTRTLAGSDAPGRSAVYAPRIDRPRAITDQDTRPAAPQGFADCLALTGLDVENATIV